MSLGAPATHMPLPPGTRTVASSPAHWSTARPWQLNSALILFGTGLLFLCKQLTLEYDSYTIGFSGVSSYSVCLYLAAFLLVFTNRNTADRYTFPIILAFAIAFRLIPLYTDPFLSSDVYRYVWDGIVQHAHISPYRYVPGDPALTFLRGGDNVDIFANMNRRDYAHTIYPPAAQALFYLITAISPTLVFMKTAMVLFEGLTFATLIAILRDLGFTHRHARMQSILFAWCPLLIWEISGSGHLDAVAMAFISLALLFRLRRRPVLTGLFLGLAVITKLYPLVLLPALLMRRDQSASPALPSPLQDPHAKLAPHPTKLLHDILDALRHLDYRIPTVTFAVIAAGYAAYSSVGRLVFGFLSGYVEEEGINSGTRYFLLEFTQHLPGLHTLSPHFYLAFCALVFLTLTLWALRVSTGHPMVTLPGPQTSSLPAAAAFLRPAFALATALMLLFSPHYPWYIAWLIPFLTLIPNLPVLTYIVLFFYLCTTALAEGTGPKQFLLNEILYGVLLLTVIVHLILKRWPQFRWKSA